LALSEYLSTSPLPARPGAGEEAKVGAAPAEPEFTRPVHH